MPDDFYVFFYGTAMDRKYAKKRDSISSLYQKAINVAGHDKCLLVDGPGSYQNKNGFLSWVNPKDWYNYNMSYLGILTGNHGPNSVIDNVNNAFEKIKKNAPDRIFLTGHSRGAIEAFMLANLLYFDKETRSIPVIVFGFDPVAGVTNNVKQNQIILNENVIDCHVLLSSECSLFGFTSIIPEVVDRKILSVYQVPTHHNGVINLSISKNPFKHDTLNINPDTAQLCLDYACQSLMLPFYSKIAYQLPSKSDLLNLHAFPNNLSYQKHIIDGRKIVFNISDDSIIFPDKEKLESLDIQFLTKEHLDIEQQIKENKTIFFKFEQINQLSSSEEVFSSQKIS